MALSPAVCEPEMCSCINPHGSHMRQEGKESWDFVVTQLSVDGLNLGPLVALGAPQQHWQQWLSPR